MTRSNTLEHRLGEVSLDASQPRKLYGYASVFDQKAQIGSFEEIIAHGAFSRSLASGRDILCQVDHDSSRVVGRTSSGTLRLSEDDMGLRFELDLPDTQEGRDLAEMARRHDLGGMSFGFFVPEGGESWSGSVRTLTDVDLVEISIVHAFPAYSGTSVNVRKKAHTPKLAKLKEALLYV